MKRIVLIMLVSFFLLIQKGYTWEDRDLYYRGVKFAKAGQADFAFMDFHGISTDYPNSKFSKNALFAQGEYYFSISDYHDSIQTFQRFISLYPESETKLFALAYLMNLAKIQGKDDSAALFEKEIIRFKHTSLIFKEYKEYKYLSAFSNKYKAQYFIDKIEISINNELFAQIIL